MQLGAFCIFQRFFQEICTVFWHLKKSSVLSREKGRYYLPFDTKGGENMEPNRTEFQKQCIFQSFCKRVLHNEACNAHDEVRRRREKFVSFSDLSLHEEQKDKKRAFMLLHINALTLFYYKIVLAVVPYKLEVVNPPKTLY